MDKKKIPTKPFFTDMMAKFKESDLTGTIQFRVTDNEDDQHYVQFADGKATYHHGAAEDSNVTIHMPEDIWHKVSHGEAEGIQALMEGQCKVDGDVTWLKRMGQIFSQAPNQHNEAKQENSNS